MSNDKNKTPKGNESWERDSSANNDGYEIRITRKGREEIDKDKKDR